MPVEATSTKSAIAYLRPKEVAEYTGLGESTLAKWRLKGRPFGEGPPYLKVGKAVLYRRDKLDCWLAERSVPAE